MADGCNMLSVLRSSWWFYWWTYQLCL